MLRKNWDSDEITNDVRFFADRHFFGICGNGNRRQRWPPFTNYLPHCSRKHPNEDFSSSRVARTRACPLCERHTLRFTQLHCPSKANSKRPATQEPEFLDAALEVRFSRYAVPSAASNPLIHYNHLFV